MSKFKQVKTWKQAVFGCGCLIGKNVQVRTVAPNKDHKATSKSVQVICPECHAFTKATNCVRRK